MLSLLLSAVSSCVFEASTSSGSGEVSNSWTDTTAVVLCAHCMSGPSISVSKSGAPNCMSSCSVLNFSVRLWISVSNLVSLEKITLM